MKYCCTHIFISAILTSIMVCNSITAIAGDEPSPSKKEKKRSTNFTFHLNNTTNKQRTVDSALIILDKFDLTGAGVVIQTAVVDSSGRLNLEDIPVGKYYAGIYTYGLNKEYIPIIINVTANTKKKNKNSVKVKIAHADGYQLGHAQIPPENIRLFAYAKF